MTALAAFTAAGAGTAALPVLFVPQAAAYDGEKNRQNDKPDNYGRYIHREPSYSRSG